MLDAAPKTSKAQLLGRILLGLMLVSSGVSHLTYLREPFQSQVPLWVPLTPGSCRSALRLCRDHTWAFPHGPLSTQSVRRHHCRSVLCSGFPWQHRSIHRTPRGIWVGHGHGSTYPTFLSACSGRLSALEYRCMDSPSTILGQTRMITVRCVKVFLGSSEQSWFEKAIPLAKRFHIL
jgi:hypothetical protein